MKGKSIKHEIGSFLQNEGMSILGVAAAKQLPSMSESFSPQTLLKGARSVICYGVQIPKGILYAKNDSLALYWRYCNMQYRTLDSVSNKLCVFLEEKNLQRPTRKQQHPSYAKRDHISCIRRPLLFGASLHPRLIRAIWIFQIFFPETKTCWHQKKQSCLLLLHAGALGKKNNPKMSFFSSI